MQIPLFFLIQETHIHQTTKSQTAIRGLFTYFLWAYSSLTFIENLVTFLLHKHHIYVAQQKYHFLLSETLGSLYKLTQNSVFFPPNIRLGKHN